LVGTIMSTLITPPFLFLMQINDMSPHVIFSIPACATALTC
jgi:hypothetical protein